MQVEARVRAEVAALTADFCERLGALRAELGELRAELGGLPRGAGAAAWATADPCQEPFLLARF